MKNWIAVLTMTLALAAGPRVDAAGDNVAVAAGDVSDAALVRSLPGYENGFAKVNGTRLHYVAGGKGEPLVLLPGWPETWWAFHKMMPRLGEHYRVIAVDIRGMGSSDKPAGGYDKKTIAQDIRELIP